MLTDFLMPFFAIGLAEFADKTQLAILLLSSRTAKRLQLLAGVMTGFLIVDGLAVLIGAVAADIIPHNIVRIAASLAFILFGLLSITAKTDDEKAESQVKSPFMSGLVMISLTEMGDKTQIAAAVFAATYDPFLVLAGALSALALMSAFAIYLGGLIGRFSNRSLLNKVAGLLFLALGISFLAY